MKEGKILFCGSFNFSDQFEPVSVVIKKHMHGQREAGTTPPFFFPWGVTGASYPMDPEGEGGHPLCFIDEKSKAW